MSKNPCQLILALDVQSLEDAKDIVSKAGPSLKWVKIGLELFIKLGPDGVKAIADTGLNIFLDLKLYDIPNTVAGAITSLKDLPISLLTLHASGGSTMIEWAQKARDSINHNVKLLGVTVLTSFDQESLKQTGIPASPQDQVLHLAQLALSAGADGVVSSPLEIELLRNTLGPDPLLVTPGIRLAGSDSNEQKRVLTPSQAASLGASHIVVGRPILHATSPQSVVESILQDIATPSHA